MYTLSSTFLKIFKLCMTSCYYAKVVVELEKTQTRNSAVLWC